MEKGEFRGFLSAKNSKRPLLNGRNMITTLLPLCGRGYSTVYPLTAGKRRRRKS